MAKNLFALLDVVMIFEILMIDLFVDCSMKLHKVRDTIFCRTHNYEMGWREAMGG